MFCMDLEFWNWILSHIVLIVFVSICLLVLTIMIYKRRCHDKFLVRDNLAYGSQLQLHMYDNSRRVVTVLKLRADGVFVREDYHGTYWIDFDDILMVYHENEYKSVSWLRECGRKHEELLGK